MNGEDLPSLSF